jgi:hypothetical protein
MIDRTLQSLEDALHERVWTPLGEGEVVYHLPDGRLLVILKCGHGEIMYPEEVRKLPAQTRPGLMGARR